ncbi:ATP cone domain-containing protein [Chryseobacterium koreense]|uniref:ATP cone domain-containing protein n=1 Tax=Chryseobacterium koreense TaxID=232216 RepID=UPI0026F363D9|nr:ATP cone domain-containing protein [Chryseobacterium koreense]
MKTFKIKKNSGKFENFDVNKLIRSLRRSKADEDLVQEVASNILGRIEEGMTTKKIYQMAFNMLKNSSRTTASRYKLKKSLMELGPTGFPFEKLVGKLMELDGFETQNGVFVQGNCVSHEVDVIAERTDSHYMIECKYHSDPGRVCDVKIPLYVQSRFLDIKQRWETHAEHAYKIHHGALFTNTRFSTDAIKYGSCVGLMLVSWDYPENGALKDRIEDAGMYPLTALSILTKNEKSQLLDSGIVLCEELANQPELLDHIGINKSRQKKILEDSRELCGQK